MIGRRSVSKGRQYIRVWIYVPTKVSEDSAFPFEVGDPCEVEIDANEKKLMVRSLSIREASLRGWARRERYRKSSVR